MKTVFLLLGTNLGDRTKHLKNAIEAIHSEVGQVVKRSSVYETQAWGKTDQPAYLNQALEVNTRLSEDELLECIHAIEKRLGRDRQEKWEARIIDIDILWYHDKVIDKPHLQVPHPLLHQRKFALVPLAEIAPKLQHPAYHKTISQLLEETNDTLTVDRFSENDLPKPPVAFERANPKYLEELSDGNEELIRNIIELFIQQTPGDMSLLSHYIERQEWDKASKQAHYIKPTFVYVGANDVHREISELESLSKERKELHTLQPRIDKLKPVMEKIYKELDAYLDTLGQ